MPRSLVKPAVALTISPVIRLDGDPILYTPLDHFSGDVSALAAWMLSQLDSLSAIGLAANQVGISQRFFVHQLGDLPPVVINPRVIHQSSTLILGEEGCLSIPAHPYLVARPKSITLEYSTLSSPTIRQDTLTDYPARVFLHEIDHLNGRTIKQRSKDAAAPY